MCAHRGSLHGRRERILGWERLWTMMSRVRSAAQRAKWRHGVKKLVYENVNGRESSQVPGEEWSEANMVNTGSAAGDCVETWGGDVRMAPRRNDSTGSRGDDPLQEPKRRGEANLNACGDEGGGWRIPGVDSGRGSDTAEQTGRRSGESSVGGRRTCVAPYACTVSVLFDCECITANGDCLTVLKPANITPS